MTRSVADINAEIRDIVDRLGRAMLDAMGGQGQKPFQREPLPVRVRGLRDAFRRVGNIAKAALYERELAEIETRAPVSSAVDAPAEGSAP